MPLQDHFQPPLSARRHWNAFHNSWATYLSSQVNALLPPGYFAEANVQFGIEIDVATWEESPPTTSPAAGWTPGPAALTVPLPLLTDIVEVQVFDSSEGLRLAGAVELVSPANEDRPAHRTPGRCPLAEKSWSAESAHASARSRRPASSRTVERSSAATALSIGESEAPAACLRKCRRFIPPSMGFPLLQAPERVRPV